MPVLLMSVAMGVEVAHWSSEQLDLQRTADVAALAGASAYARAVAAGQVPTASAVATAAADVAELNGATGAASRSWSAGSKTLADNQITAQIVAGPRNSADNAVRVTVQQSVPLIFARLVSSAGSQTLSAQGTAEVVATQQWSGAQPCVAALNTAAQGGSGITYTGWTTMTAIGCSIRSNANINETGSGGWNTQGIIAAGTVSIPFWVSNEDNKGNTIVPQQNAGTIPDAIASNAALQTAFARASQATASSIACSNQHCGLPEGGPSGTQFNGSYCNGQGTGSVTCTLQPGSYGNFAVTGGGPYTFNLQPGMYYFNGNIDLTNYTTTNGSAVTIVTTGTFNGANTFNFNLSAPDAAQAASTGGIAGIALAGNSANTIDSNTPGACNSTSTIAVCGNPQVHITGVLYFPNGTFSGQGSTTAASSSCFELLAGSVSLSGDSGYSGTCPSLGAPGFGSFYSASASLVALVQ